MVSDVVNYGICPVHCNLILRQAVQRTERAEYPSSWHHPPRALRVSTPAAYQHCEEQTQRNLEVDKE